MNIYYAALDNKYIFVVEGTVIENFCVVLIFTDCCFSLVISFSATFCVYFEKRNILRLFSLVVPMSALHWE